MAHVACHFPITLFLNGDPSSIDMEALGREVEEALAGRLRLAQLYVGADRPAQSATGLASGAGGPGSGEDALPLRTYSVPSYNGRGKRRKLPLREKAPRPRSATIQVLWSESWEDFFHRLVKAISQRFHVPESGLFQPLWVPGQRFYGAHEARAGHLIRIEVELDWDPRSPANTAVTLQVPVPRPSPAKLATHSAAADPPAKPSAPPAATGAAAVEAAAPGASEDVAYPSDVALFSSFLIRSGYIEQVANVIGPTWRAMSEAELTSELSKRFTETQLQEMFLEKYTERTVIKSRFRKFSIVSALVIGLIWARENVAQGEWGKAIAKVGGSTITAWLFNRLLYARDPAAVALLARAPGNFGRWFQGAARSNKAVNFLARDVAAWLLLWDLKDFFMSGGYGGPNIPFDIIYVIDIDDPTTWEEPSQTMLDLGFNIWYRQKETPNHPEAAGGNVYLAKVEGSAITGLLKILDIAPKQLPGLKDKLFQVVGSWDEIDLFITSIERRRVTESEKVFVLATGKRSGELVSGRGHYRSLEVVPANQPAEQLFAGDKVRWVPEYLLRPVIK